MTLNWASLGQTFHNSLARFLPSFLPSSAATHTYNNKSIYIIRWMWSCPRRRTSRHCCTYIELRLSFGGMWIKMKWLRIFGTWRKQLTSYDRPTHGKERCEVAVICRSRGHGYNRPVIERLVIRLGRRWLYINCTIRRVGCLYIMYVRLHLGRELNLNLESATVLNGGGGGDGGFAVSSSPSVNGFGI